MKVWASKPDCGQFVLLLFKVFFNSWIDIVAIATILIEVYVMLLVAMATMILGICAMCLEKTF